MATNWTDAQLSAIKTRDKTLLVSAAAGSGKTATLTERIISSLTDSDAPADISRMLIVTFTRASAADLKAKISKALSDKMIENPTDSHLATQLVALGSAHISTIDSFYYDVVKSNFQKLSLAQAPKIADDAQTIPLNLSVMNEVIEDFYCTHDTFDRFMENFTATRDNSMAAEIFISMYDKLLSQRKGIDVLPNYAADLEEASTKNIFDTKYGEVALLRTSAFVDYAYNFANEAYRRICDEPQAKEKYGEAFLDDLEFFTLLRKLLEDKNYSEFKSVLMSHAPITPSTLRGFPEFSNLRALRKDNYANLAEIRKNYFRFSDEEIELSFKENAKICLELHELLNEFDRRVMGEKASRGICTFSDIRRFVLDILCDKNGNPTDTALEYRDRFDYIYIDEYQDVDEVQDTIFTMIAKPNNRFMVGDIKQSIYGFRNADPSIFAKYKNTLPRLGSTESDEYSLFMSNNFRCDETVIDFSNAVSSFLFSNRAKSIGYTFEDNLVFSKNNNIEGYKPTPAVVALTGVTPSGEKSDYPKLLQDQFKKVASEKYVADEIERLVSCDTLSNKKISYGDIAILTRKKSAFAPLVKELESRGIPVQAPKESEFFENPDVLLVMALLSCIDNPQKDISLAGTLRSPFFGFSLDEILIIRAASDISLSLFDALNEYAKNDDALADKCKRFIDKLNYWREASLSSPCAKLIKQIYNEMSILSFGSADNKNLLRLYEYAIKFESNGFKGLYGFIKYVNELIESGVKLPQPEDGVDENCVKIMTIHSSKGLEFPICFVFGCETNFSNSSTKNAIQFDPHVGISFAPHDESGFAKYDSPLLRSIIYSKLTAEKEEEMRLLYVAMTRAKERLYMVAKLSHPDLKREKMKNLCEHDKEHAVISAKSYIDWILAALEYAEKKDCYKIVEYGINDYRERFSESLDEKALENKDTPTEEEKSESVNADISALKEILKERFDYQYPFEHISRLPAKLSVSALSPRVLDASDERAADPAELDGDFDELFGRDFIIPEALNSEKSPSSAEKGTATHAFLQFCDFDNVLSSGVENEIARLCEQNFISKRYANMINKKQLEEFFKSELYKRISTAKRIWREQRFNIFLPAYEFTQNKEKSKLLRDETIAVQGVIDIFFEDADGKIVLCDYKTDYLTREEILNPHIAAEKLNTRHAEQLSYYAMAIEAMLGKAPDEILIYSLPLKGHVQVEK